MSKKPTAEVIQTLIDAGLDSIPGGGAESLVDAVRNSDFPVVQALAMIIAGVYVGVNLIADILSILVNPRARTAISS